MRTSSTSSWLSLLLAGSTAATILAPANDLLFPSSSSATDPLQFAGANSPWWAGPEISGISSDVPSGCTVQQAAYVVRHGSRFPDSGSYNSWVAIQAKIQAAVKQGNLNATGSLSFIPGWNTALTNPTLQLSQQSMTGFKEMHDLGYQLRARYPDFYKDGNNFTVWANQYAAPINSSRVVQSAQAFLQGYLYVYAQTFGTVVAVNSTGAPDALGRSLAPADLCPLFTNNAQNNVTDWESVWAPAVISRVNSLITGNLTFTESDVLFFPYICAYESQILGNLSPWCGVFTDDELAAYEYAQDLGYFYGTGLGSSGPAQKVFLPFLDGLLTLLSEGPGQQGKGLNGANFTVPNLIMSFLNDNQISEMTAAMGIFDSDGLLPIDHIPSSRLFNVAHFITMRGTVAFEVLTCDSTAVSPTNGTGPVVTVTVTATTTVDDCAPTGAALLRRAAEQNQTYIRVLLNDAVYPISTCQNGPGNSCLLSQYASYIHNKSEAAGEFKTFCNVTTANAPTGINGAGFFTDLTLDYLTFVKSFFS